MAITHDLFLRLKSVMRIIVPLCAVLCLAAMVWSIDLVSTDSKFGSSRTGNWAAAQQPSKGEIYAIGRVEGATKEVEIRPETVGRIAEVLVKEGETVNAGDALIHLENSSQRRQRDLAAAQVTQAKVELQRLINGAHPQELAEARARVNAAIARRGLAVKTWERVRELRASTAVAQQNADESSVEAAVADADLAIAMARLERLDSPTREDEVRIAEAKVDVALAHLQVAEAELAKTQLVAPISGTILKIGAELGELIGPTSSRPTVILADVRQLRVRAFVEELNAPRVQINMPATVTADGLSDRQFRAMVIEVSPAMTTKTVFSGRPDEVFDTKVREVILDLDKKVQLGQLVLGLRVDVRIQLSVNIPGQH